MTINFFNNMTKEKKIFCAFLLVHLLVWSLIGMIRVVLPTDALEGIYWGSFMDFGTPKHPPLAGWLTYLAFIPFKQDFFVYLMSQSFIILGFIYIYRLAKKFLDENQAMLSVIILEGCWCYSYITGYYGFNPDVILLFTLPAIAFYFYQCMYENKASNWIKLGLIVGFSFLNKYQTGLIILPMAIWALMFNRETFKNKYFYFSIIIAFLIFSPHLVWLFKHDFYPVLYFESELSGTLLSHITAPLMFLIMQLALIAGSLIMFILLKRKFNSSFKFIQNYNKKDFWFILLIGLTPLIVHLLMGLSAGGMMRPRWGYEFWFMTGIMLFYFLPTKIQKEEFLYVTKSAYVVMFIIFIALGTLLAVEKNYRSRYPVAHVYNDMKAIWKQNQATPLKYIGGYIEWTLPITIYSETHPKCILDNHGYPDPWISIEELKKNGVMIIDRGADDVVIQTIKTCPYLPANTKITPIEYKFNVYNAFNQPREYTIHYYIVPPVKE